MPRSKKRNIEETEGNHTSSRHVNIHKQQDDHPPECESKRLALKDRKSLERFRIENLMQLKEDRKRNEQKRRQIELLEKFVHDEKENGSQQAKSVLREIESSQQKENIVKLNLRGKMFITTIQTLCKRENMLRVMLESQFGIDKDENGYILIDRDPDYFPIILEHLRTGSTTHIGIWEDVSKETIERLIKLLEESDFFGTTKLTIRVKELINSHTRELEEINERKRNLNSPNSETKKEEVIHTVDDEEWFAKFAMLTLEEKSKIEKYVQEEKKKVEEDFKELSTKEKSIPSSGDITIDVRGVKFIISTSKLVQHGESLFYEFAKRAIRSRGDFEIFLDRDPTVFTVIYEYLVNGTVQFIPQEIEKKKQVFKEAKFFKLKGLLEYFDLCRYPIEDIGEKNLKMKNEEDFLRNLFAVDRDNPILNDPYIQLINVFGGGGSFRKSFMESQPPEKLKLLFDFEDPTEVSTLCSRSNLVVPNVPKICSSRDQFLKQFNIFTGGIFNGMDWTNIFIAGGSVLASALAVPMQDPSTINSDLELYNRHKMTERYWENDDASSDGDVSSVKTSESNSDGEYFSDEEFSTRCTISYPFSSSVKEEGTSQIEEYYNSHPWKKSDMDLFFYDMEESEAEKKIEYLFNIFKKNLEMNEEKDILILRTQHAITFRFGSNIKPVQIILRIYKSPSEILSGFDIPCCCIGFDGTQVFCLPRAKEAIKTRCNMVDPDRQSTTYETRLVKYALRGFRIGICGFDPKKIVNPFLHGLQPFSQKPNIKQFTGLARILMILDSFKKVDKALAFTSIGGNESLEATEETLKPSSKHDYAQITFSINYQAVATDYQRLEARVDYVITELKRKPFFEYSLNDINKILRPQEMKSDLSPVVEFIQIEPARQYVGCFNPVDKNFLEDAYTFVRNERKCKYKYILRGGSIHFGRRGRRSYGTNKTLDSKMSSTLEKARRKCITTKEEQIVIVDGVYMVTFSQTSYGVCWNVKLIGTEENEDSDNEAFELDRERDDKKIKYFPKSSRKEEQDDMEFDIEDSTSAIQPTQHRVAQDTSEEEFSSEGEESD